MMGMAQVRPYLAARQVPYAALLMAGAALLVAWLPAVAVWWQYDRQAIATGELWRIFTGHWTHVSVDHLFWDVLLFTVLGVLCEQHCRREFVVCVAGATLCIPLTLWVLLPHLSTYRGLSGIDSALFALLAVTHLRQALQEQHRGYIAALSLVCLCFVAKVSYEGMTGGTLFVNSQAVHMLPVPLAHGVGAVVGLVVGWARPTPGAGALAHQVD
jgi:rhomboid family GlyGly-CTERM serine protease